MKESKQVEWNVLATIDYVCTHTKRKKLNYEKSPKMIKCLENLKHYFGDINETQVIILCAILDINLSNINNMSLHEYFAMSSMNYLQHNGEIEELNQKNILSVDIKKNGHMYTINTNIITSILRNQEIHFETETLDPVSFVTEISEIIESCSSSYDERIIKARNIENKNKKLSFVQELMNILPKYKDRFCFYLLCNCYTQDWTLSFQRLFHSVYSHSAQNNMCLMLSEKHELIKKDFVTFIKKGNVMDSTLSITDKSKHFFLGDDEYLYEKNFNEKAIIIPEAINKKQLFYGEENQNQINMIYNFLNENNLSNIQNGLKAKGFPTGICILLYGAPGTGKTESVYQIAKSTNRSIIHVDISQTKSCWFGESEKKIQDIFDNYNRLCKKLQVNGKNELPILLFNEADAIIQKRTEFSGGGAEKTENAMQNILLENLEKFEGILIATTNLEINMDTAFERRFLYKIKFENPTVEAKTAIWKSKLNWISEEKAKQLAKEYDFSGGEQEETMAKEKIKKQYLNGYERILKIDHLIASGKYPSVKELAQATEASIPTINRDLNNLRMKFGAEDILQYDRNKKGFYYTRHSFRIPAMLTSEKQIIAAQLMSNLLNLIKNTPVYKKAIEIFNSLSDNIDEDTKLNAKKLSNRILFLGMNPVKIDDEVWSKLEEAMSKNNYVSFDYLDYKIRFTVQPWQLIYSEGMWSLYAYNQMPEVKKIRFYNLTGIHNLEIITKADPFVLPPDFEYTKRAKGNFRRYIGPQLLHCKLKITSEKTLNYIKTYEWTEDQKFEKQQDGSTIMTFSTNQDYPVLGWVLSHGMYVKPLEPEWLVKEWEKNVIEMWNNI